MDGNNSFSSISLPCGEQQIVQNGSFKRFFIVKRTDSQSDSSFKRTSPFLIAKTFQSILGDDHTLKKLQSGDLLVEVFSAKNSQLLSNSNTIGSFSVSVQIHQTLNTSRGVISEPDLLFSTKEELLLNLKDQNVIDVRRITIRRNGQVLPTKHVILTFNNSTLPSRIKAAYLSCPVRPYIPNPLRCFKCQHYGHTNTTCRGSITCARCAEVGHDGKTCEKPERCANCNGDHTSYSRSCPKWILEKEILTVKITQKLSYPEARKIVDSRTPSVGVSYSSLLKQHSKYARHISTQTESSSPTDKLPITVPCSCRKKSTHNKSCSASTNKCPKLELWPPSAKPVIIEHFDPAIHRRFYMQKPSILYKNTTENESDKNKDSQSKKSSEHVHQSQKSSSQSKSIEHKTEQTSSSSACSTQKSKTNPPPKASQKSCAQKPRKNPSNQISSQWKTVKGKYNKSHLSPGLKNIKDSKQLINHALEAMELDSDSYDSDDDNQNTVFEEFDPT